jgi:hypothetical protein
MMGQEQKDSQYMIPHIFKALQEANKHSAHYNSLAESTDNPDLQRAYEEFTEILDSLFGQILQVGKYSNKQEVNLEAVTTKEQEGLASYAKVMVNHIYDNGYVLAEDTAGELHLIAKENIRYTD